jgi:enoyl-CoA hydratase
MSTLAPQQATIAPGILLRADGSLRTITLNRPEALNALTLDMVRTIEALLDQFESDPSVSYVALEGAGERGLCAGGDIRTLYQSVLEGTDWAETFWREEYALNARIARYGKPYIAFMDGIVMGGGMGVSAHARHRIVTERTKVAMPEVGIGLIPDVGGTWLLSRAPGEIGTCLALTGMAIGGGDAIYAGLADYFVPSSRLASLKRDLARLPTAAGDDTALGRLLRSCHERPSAGPLEANRAEIDACMARDAVEEIVASLARSNTPFGSDLLGAVRGKSPTSLKVALRLLRLARGARNLEECLEREYAAVLHAAACKRDIVEGIRAAVIDKDRNPKWQPARLEDVSEQDVAGYLTQKPLKPIPFRSRGVRP